jgi:hypothetical protein
MSKLKHITLTKDILMANLKPKAKPQTDLANRTEQKFLPDESDTHLDVGEENPERAGVAPALTKQDYKDLLKDFEEIEDMMCSICMEHMAIDEVIVKTKCGEENLLP